MFVTNKNRGYTRDGEQKASGKFLVVFCDDHHNLWGCVRHCVLTQCGHWMMGSVKIGSQRITVSGSYGGDGLPKDLSDVKEENRKFLTAVPADIAEKFWHPEHQGWNSAGSEAGVMREWALSI